MVKEVVRYEASDGSTHTSLDEAVVHEVARLLGKIGNGDASMSIGIARVIVEKRGEMTQCLAQLPASTSPAHDEAPSGAP